MSASAEDVRTEIQQAVWVGRGDLRPGALPESTVEETRAGIVGVVGELNSILRRVSQYQQVLSGGAALSNSTATGIRDARDRLSRPLQGANAETTETVLGGLARAAQTYKGAETGFSAAAAAAREVAQLVLQASAKLENLPPRLESSHQEAQNARDKASAAYSTAEDYTARL